MQPPEKTTAKDRRVDPNEKLRQNCLFLRRAAINCASDDNRWNGRGLFAGPRPSAIGVTVIISAVGRLLFSTLVNSTPLGLTLILLLVFAPVKTVAITIPRTTLSNLTDVTVTTSGRSSYDPMWVHRLIFASLNGLLFLLGLANVLVLFIVSRYRRMRTVTNILIFNLCLADLIYVSFLPVVIMFQLLRDWMFGVAACKLFYITESTAKYASVYFVLVLSLDRYFALCHPQVCKRYRRPSLALLVSAVGWFVTAALMTPIYLFSTVVGSDGERFCTVSWPSSIVDFQEFDQNETVYDCVYNSSRYEWNQNCSNQTYDESNQDYNDTSFYPTIFSGPPNGQFYYITLTFVFCFGLPAALILFFYFKVLDQLFQASNRAERLKKRREKTYRKVTRMVLAVVSFYLICWIPYWTQFLVVTFVTFTLNNAWKIFFNSIHLLPYLNCAMNPILYSLMTDNFRKILSELFPLSPIFACCRWRRQRSSRGANQGQIQGQGMALLERATKFRPDNLGDDLGDNARFLSLSSSISPSIRMVSDFSINFLTMSRRESNDVGSTSATSVSTP